MRRGKRYRAQVSLELGTAIVLILLLILGSVNLAVWLVGRMTVRQEDYEASRDVATNQYLGVEVDETNSARYMPLRFFGQ